MITLSAVAQRVWIARNRTPPELFDDANHLFTSLALYQTLSRQGWVEFIRQFIHSVSHYFHPPLVPALSAPFYAWFGPGVAAALWVNTLFLVLLYGFLFRLVRLWAGEEPAVIAVAITALSPMTYGLARLYLLEFGLAAVVVVWLYYFCRSGGLADRRYLPGLGLGLGCGLLIKATFPLYIVGPALWEIFWEVRRGGKITLPAAVVRVLIVGAIGSAWALPWYGRHMGEVWEGAGYVTGWLTQPAVVTAALAWPRLLAFWTTFLKEGISVYFFTLGLALLGVLWVRRSGLPRRTVGFLLAWWIPPFLMCSLTIMKISRYLFPAFPALAALLGLMLMRVLPASRTWRALVFGGLLLIPLGNFLQLSFFDVWMKRPARVWAGEPLGLLVKTDGYVLTYRPRRARWSFEPILATLQAHTATRPPQEIRGSMYFEWYALIPSNLMYLGMTRNIPMRITPVLCRHNAIMRCFEEHGGHEFFLMQRPTTGARELEKALDAGRVPYREIATFYLWPPSDNRVVVYQRN